MLGELLIPLAYHRPRIHIFIVQKDIQFFQDHFFSLFSIPLQTSFHRSTHKFQTHLFCPHSTFQYTFCHQAIYRLLLHASYFISILHRRFFHLFVCTLLFLLSSLWTSHLRSWIRLSSYIFLYHVCTHFWIILYKYCTILSPKCRTPKVHRNANDPHMYLHCFWRIFPRLEPGIRPINRRNNLQKGV